MGHGREIAHKDHVHPSDIGYQWWADALSAAVLGEYGTWRRRRGLPTPVIDVVAAHNPDAALPGATP